MYMGVALKWAWFVLALYVAFAHLKLDAVPLLIGLVTAQFGYWIGVVPAQVMDGRDRES